MKRILLLSALLGMFFHARSQTVPFPTGYRDYEAVSPWGYTNKGTNWDTSPFLPFIYQDKWFRIMPPAGVTYNSSTNTWTNANPGQKYPVILFFQGAGEVGTDNNNQLKYMESHKKAVQNGTFPGFILAPQSQAADGAKILIDKLLQTLPIDPNRIYVHGLSNGAVWSWDFAIKYPTRVAALFPMSGVDERAKTSTLLYTPIRLAQGGLDTNPAPNWTQTIVDWYTTNGGNMEYFYMPTTGHGTWTTQYAKADFFSWFLSKKKNNPLALYAKTQTCPGAPIDVKLGLTPGFAGYEWRKDGVLIAGANSATLNVTSFGIYTSRINNAGTWSDWSDPVNVSLKPPTATPAIQVSGLKSSVLPAPDGSTTTALELPDGYESYTWKNASTNAVLSSDRIFEDVPVGSYKAAVQEKNGCSSNDSPIFNVVNSSGPQSPDAVSGFIGYATTQTDISLSWVDNPTPQFNETNFEVYRATSSGGPFKLVAKTAANSDSYIDSNLTPNTNYYYLVRPINLSSAGPVSETITVKTQVDAIPPTAPTNLAITNVNGNSVSLSWTASTDNVGVYRYDIFKNGERVLALSNTTTATVYNLTEDEVYSFFIKARDVTGNYSPASNQVTTAALAGLDYKYYEAATTWTTLPNFSTLTPVETGNTANIDLTVRNRTTNYAMYWEGQIYIPVAGSYTFETNSDDGSKLYIGGYNELNLVVNNDGVHSSQYREGTKIFATAGMYPIVITYFLNGSGGSMQVFWKNTPIGVSSRQAIPNWAFQKNLAMPLPPTAPRNVAVAAVSYNQINVSWTDQSNNEEGFQIFRATTNAGPYIPVGEVDAGVTSYADKSVQPNTTYYYRVEALGQYGQSGPSDEILHGLKYAYYPRTLANVGQMASYTPAKTGIVSTVDMSPRTQTTNYGFTWEGKIKIATTGNYTFYTTSDDASQLYIDGVLRINNDASPSTSERSVAINGLTAGQHTIKVLYRQSSGTARMEVRYSGPSISKQLIPATALTDTEPNATTPALPPVPTAPTNLVATATSANSIALTWNDNSSDEANFQLYRSAGDASSFIVYKTLPANTTSFTDADLFANYTFYYKVVAINAGGSTTSNVVNTTTLDNAPVITEIVDLTMKFNTEANINIIAADPDHEPITLSVVGLPSFGTFSDYGDGTGLLKFNPSQSQLGNYPLSVIAADQHSGKDTTSFVLIVTDKNPPALLPISDLSVNENGTGSVVLSATSDLGAGNLVWSNTGLPSFATLNVTNGMGTISFAPGYTDSGVYPITIKIKDSQNNEATRSFTLTVGDVNPNTTYYVDLESTGTTSPAPWNTVTGLTTSGLEDDKGNTTSVGVAFQTTAWATYTEGAVTGNNSGVFPDAVIQDYYYFGIFGNPNTVDVNVTGLDPAKQYNFKFLGSSKWTGVADNGSTVYTIGATSVTLNVQNNNQNLAVINNVTPNASGVVTFTLSKAAGSQVGYLNAFVVENVYQPGTAPAAPRNVAATINEDSKVEVTWVDAPFNETGFNVYRSTTQNGTYTKLTATALPANTTVYVDGTIEDGVTYYYKVTSVNSIGTSADSNIASIAVPNLAPKITVTGALTIGAGVQSTLSVTALDPPTNAVTITVTGLPSFATYQSLTATTGSIVMNPTGDDDGEYTFTVNATDSEGAVASQDVTVEVGEVPLYKILVNFSQTSNAPAPWNNTSKVPAAGDVFSNLKDDSNVNRNVSLTLQTAFGGVYNESPQTGDNSGVVPDAVLKEYYWFGIFSAPNTETMKLSGLSKSNRYNFKFIASSNFSNNGSITENGSTVFTINGKSASVKVQNNTTKVGIIDGIVTNASGEITITVTKGADAAAGFVNGFILEAVAVDPSTFTPSNLTAAGTASQVVLGWSDNSPEETGFQIYRSTTGAPGSFTLLTNVGADVTSYTDASVSSTQLYYYHVRATLASGTTGFSNTASAGLVRFRVYVNLNGEATTDAPAPWNNTSRFGLTNDIFYGFKDENGKATGLQMRVQHELESSNTWGMNTGNNSGVFPDKVLQSFWFNDAYFPVGEFAVENLDQTFNYNFGFLGAIDVTNAVSTQFSIGDKVVTNVNNKNISNISYLRAIEPSGNSDVLITVKEASGSPWSIWNALIIEGYPTDRKASTNGRRATSTGTMREVRYGESNPEIVLYPNPLTGSTLTIESKDSSIGDVRYEVSDVMGKSVQTGTISNDSIDAEFSVDFGKQSLSSGVYLLKLQYPDGRTLTKKFVKN